MERDNQKGGEVACNGAKTFMSDSRKERTPPKGESREIEPGEKYRIQASNGKSRTFVFILNCSSFLFITILKSTP